MFNTLRAVLPAWLAVVFALAGSPARAIDRDLSLAQLHHTAWTARDGVPPGLQVLAQTEDGYLWLGTANGLFRFDGVRFEKFVQTSGSPLPDGDITYIQTLPDGGLFIGQTFGGASLIRAGKVVNFGVAQGFPSGSVKGFASEADGTVWAATNGGLARFDGQHWQRIGADWGYPGVAARTILLLKNGDLLVQADGGFALLPKGKKQFDFIQGPSGATAFAQGADGTIYYADREALWAVSIAASHGRDHPRVQAKPLQPGIGGLLRDRWGALWMISLRSGLSRLAYPERAGPVGLRIESYTQADGLSGISVPGDILEDRDGNIWVTTANGLDRFRQTPILPVPGMHGKVFPALVPDGSAGVWVGDASGLTHLDASGQTLHHSEGRISTVYRDSAGTLWFGRSSNNKTDVLRIKDGVVIAVPLPAGVNPQYDVQAITKDATGALWVSIIRTGVFRQAGGAWTRVEALADGGKGAAVTLFTDSQGGVWLGYPNNRVAHWNNGLVREFGPADGLDLGVVKAIHEHGSHLWFGGDRGLAILASNRFRRFLVEQPEAIGGVAGIVETAERDVWLACGRGAVLLAAPSVKSGLDMPQRPVAARLFNADDGLTGIPPTIRPLPAVTMSDDGRLWFTSNSAAFMLDPRRLVTNKTPPNVMIESLRSGEALFRSPAEVTLPIRTTGLEIAYTAPSLSIPQRVRFRYRLDGVDDDWQDAGTRRTAFYTRLEPGIYRFRVIAANEDGVWNTAGAALSFTIPPAFYQTWWFRTLCVLALASMLWLFYRMRLRQVAEQVKARLQERLVERERIARELHDTLLQSVHGLILHFQAATMGLAKDDPVRERFEQALGQADRVVAEGRERIRDLRNEEYTPDSLEEGLRAAGAELGRGDDELFTVTSQGSKRSLHPVVVVDGLRIAREAIMNARRHAGASRIEAEVVYGAYSLRLRVRDDGVGVDPDIVKRGGIPGHWGLSSMKERAQKLGGQLQITNRPGAGTEVELSLPAAVAYAD